MKPRPLLLLIRIHHQQKSPLLLLLYPHQQQRRRQLALIRTSILLHPISSPLLRRSKKIARTEEFLPHTSTNLSQLFKSHATILFSEISGDSEHDKTRMVSTSSRRWPLELIWPTNQKKNASGDKSRTMT